MTENKERTNLITPNGMKRLLDEVRQLWDVERPKVVDEVHQAALQGDRSENAEYIYGKKRLREIDRRLEFLNRRIESAKVIDPARQHGDSIMFGATVVVEDEDGVEKTYHIVGEDEADPNRKRISHLSPIGKALLSKKSGNYVEVEAPRGTIGLTVKDFVYRAID